jgi:hypothetical protein
LAFILVHDGYFFYITQNDTPQSVGLLLTSDQLVADIYLTTHNTQNRQKSMRLVGFEPMISAGERPYTYVLDRAATGNKTSVHATNI